MLPIMSLDKAITSILLASVTLMTFSVLVLAYNFYGEEGDNTVQATPASDVVSDDIDGLLPSDLDLNSIFTPKESMRALNVFTTNNVQKMEYTNSRFPDVRIMYPNDWKVETVELASAFHNTPVQKVRLEKDDAHITYTFEPLQEDRCSDDGESLEPKFASISETDIHGFSQDS